MKNTSFVLRTVSENMTSRDGFQWPEVGAEVAAPDWSDRKQCGNGLHGWLFGQGDHGTSPYLDETAKWMVLEVESDSIIMLGGKCKFPRGVVRFVGDKKGATDYLHEHEPRSRNVAVIGATRSVSDGESVNVGAFGTATAGDSGTATAGDSGTATAGYRGTATAGDSGSTATAGVCGELRIRFYDYAAERYRTVVGYIGEDGLEPNVPYRLDDNRKFVRA
ncbi:ice nucleation protein [Burkholderia phage Mica]|uniref:Ice nucleation protein n=1 Tax=Burkholderia phage Mica TaxID=2767579 RepID=A0A873WTU2_9CAUD|nr:ice nucleation protein [Burkholderia phage Mica]QPB08664.1 ice nucleation protein [Burkholderia phage Mica]